MSSSPDRLVYMANQIGTFFRSQGSDKTVPGVAEHIRKFWDPRMRKQIFAHLDAGGAGLDPDVREAIVSLRTPSTVASVRSPGERSDTRDRSNVETLIPGYRFAHPGYI
jgi:formate dehydrogenase subunit delta